MMEYSLLVEKRLAADFTISPPLDTLQRLQTLSRCDDHCTHNTTVLHQLIMRFVLR